MPKTSGKASTPAKNGVQQPNQATKKPASAPRVQNVPGTVVAPMATTRVISSSPQTQAPYTLRRKEYVGDIAGSVNFATTQYSFNPGLPNLFPWGSGIAPSYETYTVESVKFSFETESPSTTTGVIVLSFDYDALDAAPVDKVSAMLISDHVRAAPWVPSTLTLNKRDLNRRDAEALFIRTGSVSSSDLKTYDLGNLFVSTVGQANTNVIGELWIEYVIHLHTPQRPNPPGQLLTVTGASKTAPFTGTQTSTGIQVATASGTTLTFQVAGYYIITHYISGTSCTTVTLPTISTGGTITAYYTSFVQSTTQALSVFVVRVLAGSTLTFDDATGNTTVTSTTTAISPWFTT